MRVVIVDDEAMVLRGITNMIPWKDIDIELAGTAQDGIAGFQLIQQEKPEIVITDIRMPGMLGLEMIRRVKEINPETLFIILSGYSEFEYARQAIEVGVFTYLEKPVSLDELKKVLLNAREVLAKRRNALADTGSTAEGILRNLLYDAQKRNVDLSELKMDGFAQDCIVRICVAVCAPCGEMKKLPSDIEQIRNIIQGLATDNCYIIYALADERIAVLLLFEGKYSPIGYYRMLKKLDDSLQLAGYTCHIGIAEGVPADTCISKVVSEAVKAYQEAAYKNIAGIYMRKKAENSLQTSVEKEKQNVLQCVRNHDLKQIRLVVSAFLDHLNQQDSSLERIQHETLALIYNCIEAVDLHDRVKNNEWVYKRMPYASLFRQRSYERYQEYLICLFEDMVTFLEENDRHVTRQQVRKGMDYIEGHYKEDLSLQVLSDYVGLNASYFCVLFKEDAGVSYSRYLLDVRMRHAKELLNAGEKVVNVSQMVGYYNYRHFCKAFKKYTGLTPKEFRDHPNNSDKI